MSKNFSVSQEQLQKWFEQGQKQNYLYMALFQDLEDKEIYPVYFHFYSDLERYKENIISESKTVFKIYYKLSSLG